MTGGSTENGGTSSELSGNAGDVVQARDITGGIHFHGSTRESVPIPAQLPADVRGFVNRTADLQHLDTVLGKGLEHPGSASVCVIAGTAGVGKTSLAVRWAHRNRGRFPDGQLYVNLRGYDPGQPVTAAQALERFLAALGIASGAVPADLAERSALFRSLLADRRILIVLDNAATVGQVRPLLPGVGRCRVLVTSRSRLSGLITRDGAHRITLEVFGEPEAVELLRTTTAEYRSGDEPDELAELARLCARLPLALRIAAERAAARPRTPLDDLIDDLRDESSRWDALTAEDDDEADAVRTVFAWSYRALQPEAARLFRLLGLHPGPEFSTHAAAALAGYPVRHAQRLLDSLVGAHLLEQRGADRFQFHDLLRAYAHDQATRDEEPADRHAALDRVLTWYLHAADDAVSATNYGYRYFELDPSERSASGIAFPDHGTAVSWYEAERANLLAATTNADRHGFNRVAWQIPAMLSTIYSARHPFDDWFAASHIGLDAARREESRTGEACLLLSLGQAQSQTQSATNEALSTFAAALDLYRAIGDRRGEIYTLTRAAVANLKLHRPAEAQSATRRAVNLARELGDAVLESDALGLFASSCFQLGDLEQADRCAQQSLRLIEGRGHFTDELNIISTVISIQRGLGQLGEAATTAERMIALARDVSSRLGEAGGSLNLGEVRQLKGEHAAALADFQLAAAIWRSLGHRSQEALAIDATGTSLQALGRFHEAIGFHARAAATHREMHDSWHEAIAMDHLAAAQRQLDLMAEATASLQAAQALLQEFDDPPARTLKASIAATLEQAAA